jgi:hypothetical protein
MKEECQLQQKREIQQHTKVKLSQEQKKITNKIVSEKFEKLKENVEKKKSAVGEAKQVESLNHL